MADDWITTRDAVKLSGYNPIHLRALIRHRRIKARKYFVIWQISRKSLEAYLSEQAQRGEKRGRKPKDI
jgi:hypothetical protein